MMALFLTKVYLTDLGGSEQLTVNNYIANVNAHSVHNFQSFFTIPKFSKSIGNDNLGD